MAREADVVVVGAGVIGCAAAHALAPDRDVVVLDRQGVAAGATGRSAGLVSPTLFYGDLPDCARHANAFFRSFDGTGSFAFTERRRYDLVSPGEAEAGRERAARLRAEGFPVAYREAAEVERRAPRLDLSAYPGAVEFGDTGWVDPYALADALRGAAERRGARFDLGAEVTAVCTEAGRVTGVETADGRIAAEHVVVAAGWRTPDLLAGLVDLPVVPYRTQCATLEAGWEPGPAFPMVRLGGEGLYLRPEHNGDLLVGGSPSKVREPAAASRSADEAFRTQVAQVLPSLFREFEGAGFANGWAGLDAATPDGRPIIDAPGPDGLVVATGFNGLGVTVAPVAAAGVRQLVGGEAAPFGLAPFRLDRFASASGGFDLHSTSDF